MLSLLAAAVTLTSATLLYRTGLTASQHDGAVLTGSLQTLSVKGG